MISLAEHLYNYGYSTEDSKSIDEEYNKGGIDSAVFVIADWDCSKHDYSGELVDVISDWEKGY